MWEELSGGKEDELALSYMQQQLSSGHLSSHSHLCGSEKLWQRLVLSLCFGINLGTLEILCASVFRSLVCLSVSDQCVEKSGTVGALSASFSLTCRRQHFV